MKTFLAVLIFFARCLIGALAGGLLGIVLGFLCLFWLSATGRMSGDQSIGMLGVPMILGYVGLILGAAVGFIISVLDVLSVLTKKPKS